MALTAQQEIEKIRTKLGHLSLKAQPAAYLDTGIPDLNEVMGSRDLGIPYGRIIEISGWESQGKTALALCLLAIGQRDNAMAILGDFEVSYDPKWVSARGVNTDNLTLFQPYVGTFGSEKTPRLCTAEELCTEIEEAMSTIYRHKQKSIVLVDSVPAMMPDIVASAGIEGRNMRTNMGLPMFMSGLVQRWVGLAQAYSAIIIFINQLRTKPMAFGDPAYTPGGNALPFYAHIRVRAHRVKGGRILKQGRVAGIKGILTNNKNKAGGREKSTVGYKIMFDGPIEFLDAKELKKDADDE